jgi:hypothetical protein
VSDVFSTGVMTPVVLTNGVRTMLELIAAASHPLQLTHVGVSYDGSAAAAGILHELVYLTATGTGTAQTVRALDQISNPTISAVAKYNDTVEPTVGHSILPFYVPPSQFDRFVLPIDDYLMCGPGTGWGLRVTAVTGNLPKCAPFFICHEF